MSTPIASVLPTPLGCCVVACPVLPTLPGKSTRLCASRSLSRSGRCVCPSVACASSRACSSAPVPNFLPNLLAFDQHAVSLHLFSMAFALSKWYCCCAATAAHPPLCERPACGQCHSNKEKVSM